jgi:hypothetical protein
MSSEKLVERLVADLRPVRRSGARRDTLLLASLCAAELGLLLLAGLARPDLFAAMRLPSFWWKMLSLGTLAVAGVATALRSFDPAWSTRVRLRGLALLVLAILAAGCGLDALGEGGQAFAMRLMWRDGVHCVVTVVLLSLPPLLALGLLMRRGAPVDRPGSALAVGVAGAGCGAFLFIFSCPHDDPLYVMVWYGLGGLVVAGIARLLLPRFARW